MPEPDAPSTKRPAPPPADAVVAQRTLVYSVTALIALTGLVLAMAFKDACAAHGGESAVAAAGKTCADVVTIADHRPDGTTVFAMIAVWVLVVLAYELRWIIRTWLPGALGAVFLAGSAAALAAGRPLPLVVAYTAFGVALIACSYGIYKERREGWAFAVSIFGVEFVAHFFGTSVIRSAFGVHLAIAVLPALGLFLPALIALVTSPPGAPRYAPFGKKPLAR